MPLLTHAKDWLHRVTRRKRRLPRRVVETPRLRGFEWMEPRQLLSAAPLYVGAVYIEEDTGSDVNPDTFELTFAGGAEDTQLTRLEINTDQNAPGLSSGDLIFDIAPGGLGADLAHPFTLLALQTADPQATVRASVEDGGMLLVLELSGFQAGDKLRFTIDVDEVVRFDPAQTELETINESIDPITSGIEFQGSQLIASFAAPHYHDITATAEFFDRYDSRLAGSGLDLPADDHQGKRSRTTGAVTQTQQQPLPISIAGTVYLDHSLDLRQDAGEPGLAGVALTLWRLDNGSYRSTGHTTTTDAQGRYAFGTELELLPGTYQVRETQPEDLFSVGAVPGTVAGQPTGRVVPDDRDVLTDIAIPLGDTHAVDFDFAEAAPARISGYVYHDRNNDGRRDGGEEGLQHVQLVVTAVDAIHPQSPLTVTTDSTGYYVATGLAPGVYRVVQPVQPTGYLDGLDAAGTVAGQPRGQAENPGDALHDIVLRGGQSGIDYNFGELLPVSIEGQVCVADRFGDCDATGGTRTPLPGATVRLLDNSGQLLAETQADADGRYRFTGLRPGSYAVAEITPDGYIDGGEHPGTVGGQPVGRRIIEGTIGEIVLASGQRAIDYDFCEYLPAQLSGHVYHDRNNDGQRDAGEEGLAGVELSLIDAEGQRVARSTTDANGSYQFVFLHAGVYAVVQTHPSGWIDGHDSPGSIGGRSVGQADEPGDRIGQIALWWGDEGVDYDFGELLLASISGSTHLTGPDGDCYTPGGGQTPLAGVLVRLLDSAGRQLAQTRSDAQGNYRFDSLLPGNYTVVEETPAGLIDGPERAGSVAGQPMGTVSANDTISGIALTSGQTATGYDFCEHAPASLSGSVYHDRNQNGRRDPGEEPLAGVTVRLLDEQRQVLATGQTDANGRYEFENLRSGQYAVEEVQPAGYLDGLDTPGTIAGATVGAALNPGDEIGQIALRWGDVGQDYNFGELLSGSLAGLVFVDLDLDCHYDAEEQPLAGVTVELLDSSGRILTTMQTDHQGRYRFADLAPGEYTVREHQPAGYFQGGQRAGSGGGNASLEDVISEIAIGSGQHLTDYDFCEVPPSSLSGRVHLDANENGRWDAGEQALAGVTIRLLDARGQLLAETATDAAGRYHFADLHPGHYVVHELQPREYFHGGQRAGSHGGDATAADRIAAIRIPAGQTLEDYDFFEVPAARLSGYVFQDGDQINTWDGRLPQDVWTEHPGRRTDGSQPLQNVVLELRDARTGLPVRGEQALPGSYSSGPISVRTNADGYYEFVGLPSGLYDVVQIQPQGFVDGLDTPGTTGGVAFNPNSALDPQLRVGREHYPQWDAIVSIALTAGGLSEENNFSEIVVSHPVVIPPPPPPETVSPQPKPLPPIIPPPAPPPIFPFTPDQPLRFPYNGSGGVQDFSWHLSVIDAGSPRGQGDPVRLGGLVWRAATFLDVGDWYAQPLDQGRWTLGTQIDASGGVQAARDVVFGDADSIPVIGDWNGDGSDDLGVYHDGHFFLDLNGNGRWDDEDLWARLGDELDFPVSGDWNGDGKDDIGIFGPAWPGDPQALQVESGLPDMRNRELPVPKPKNVPPQPEDATSGLRLLRRTAIGKTRADVIDHVFRYGASAQIPVTGDWSGDGIKNIGVFRDGRWRLDADGDGRWSETDRVFEFGQEGDLPVVGDFNGDGISEIGVFRNGQWIVDMNGNHELDAHDAVFSLGGPGDMPVAGDWTGDGVDKPGVYHPADAAPEAPRADGE